MKDLLAALLAVILAGMSGPTPAPPTHGPTLPDARTVADILAGDGGEADARTWAALARPYQVEETTGAPCRDMALTMMRTGDYRPDMAGCFGDEDSDTVAVILSAAGW